MTLVSSRGFRSRCLPWPVAALIGLSAAAVAQAAERNGFDLSARDPYQGYNRDQRLYFPVRFSSNRYHPKERVIGVTLNRQHKAYPFVELARAGASLEDRFGGKRIRIEFDAVHRMGRVLDEAGREIPSVIEFWFAWYAFHPATDVFAASRTSSDR